MPGAAELPAHRKGSVMTRAFTVLVVVSTLAACTDPSEEAERRGGSHVQASGAPCGAFVTHCQLQYYNAGLETRLVHEIAVPVVAGEYPFFTRVMGTPELPYSGTVAATPKASSDGTF